MGFISDLFGTGGSESRPAPPTIRQEKLQDQALHVGEQQIGNISLTTDLFERLMGNLTRGQTRGHDASSQLFGATTGAPTTQRNDFVAQQQQDLNAFKASLRPDTTTIG